MIFRKGNAYLYYVISKKIGNFALLIVNLFNQHSQV